MGPPPVVNVAVGRPTYRNPGSSRNIISQQIKYGRLTQTQADDPLVFGYASTMDCRHIGHWVGIDWPGGPKYPYLVIDCVASQDREYNRGIGFAVEVDKIDWLENFSWPEYMSGDQVVVWTVDLQSVRDSVIMAE